MTFTHINPEGVWDDAWTFRLSARLFQRVLTKVTDYVAYELERLAG